MRLGAGELRHKSSFSVSPLSFGVEIVRRQGEELRACGSIIDSSPYSVLTGDYESRSTYRIALACPGAVRELAYGTEILPIL